MTRTCPVATAVAAVALLLTACGAGGVATSPAASSSPGPTTQATTTSPDGVVPFRGLPPSGRNLPVTMRPARPDPEAVQGVPACRAKDLTVQAEGDGAMGTRFVNVTLGSKDGSPCVLSGHPKVRAVTKPSSRQVPTRNRDRMPAYGKPFVVMRTAPGTLVLAWSSRWCGEPVSVTALVVSIPGGGEVRVDGFGPSACYADPDPDAAPEPIDVGSFSPLHRQAEEAVSPLADLTVTMEEVGTVSRGGTLRFVTRLHASHDVVLDPCPDWTVYAAADGGYTEQRYTLDCAALGTPDAAGRPVLPAGQDRRFAVEVKVPDVPAGTVLKVGVQLDPGEQPVGDATSVTVAG